MAVTVDTTQLDALAATLAAAPARLRPAVKAVVSKGALNVKNGMVADATGHAFLPRFPYTISYDITATATTVQAEIGPDHDKPQGPLAGVVYFGTSRSGPVASLTGPIEREAPAFERFLAVATAKATL